MRVRNKIFLTVTEFGKRYLTFGRLGKLGQYIEVIHDIHSNTNEHHTPTNEIKYTMDL